jgi:L-alanine-DL-glutamate epimerase-like enolase superfamily enzyme
MMPTTITSMSAHPLDLRLTEPFAIAGGAQLVASNVVVRITLADGTVGIGEAAPFFAVSGETRERSLAALESMRELVVERDVRTIRPLARRLKDRFPDEPASRCAIEVAALDAMTRHYGMPLWSFFGGAGTTLETDMTITAGDAASAGRAAEAVVRRGISVIKVKVGALSPRDDAARLCEVKRAAPGARLLADANQGYEPDDALEFLRLLLEFGVPIELFEQPVPREMWTELARRPLPFPVLLCADESARSAEDVLDLARNRAAHAINIKPMKTGVVEALAMWDIARTAGMAMMIGGMVESMLAMSFSAHFAAGLGGFSYVDLDTPMFIADSPFEGGFLQRGALLDVAHIGAGHGVSWPL